jgi:hypothetical protein
MSHPASSTAAALAEAAEGLTYQSEADFPVEPFVLPGSPGEPVTAEGFLRAIGQAPGTAVRTQSLERFFEPVTQEEPWHRETERQMTERFKRLEAVLRENLTDLKVFKIGKTRSQVYVVGRTPSGELAGVKTTVVET